MISGTDFKKKNAVGLVGGRGRADQSLQSSSFISSLVSQLWR